VAGLDSIRIPAFRPLCGCCGICQEAGLENAREDPLQSETGKQNSMQSSPISGQPEFQNPETAAEMVQMSDKETKVSISVIIPVFNAEHYLCDCFEALQAQTFTDFELILINDGSQDHSLDLIYMYLTSY